MSASETVAEGETEVVFEAELESISEEVPMSEWSSLEMDKLEQNEKKLLHAQGLYDIGSGELCTKYIALSDSFVFRHPHYSYPAVTNPGVEEAIFGPVPRKYYDSDGKDLYLDICEQLGMSPCRMFLRNLISSTIDLSYYGVNPDNMKAMASALAQNQMVERFKLVDNHLNIDACYHLGALLMQNSCLVELDLSGCNIRKEGAERIINGLYKNRTLCILNLSSNSLLEEGGEVVAVAFARRGFPVEELRLRYNDLSKLTTEAFLSSFETYNNLTVLDLSWNKFYVGSTSALIHILTHNENLRELDLSWNSLSSLPVATALGALLKKSRNMTHLNLSNNKFSAVRPIVTGMIHAKKLHTLNLSSNPLSSTDAFNLLKRICTTTRQIVMKCLLLDNVLVTSKFEELYNIMRKTKDIEITFETLVIDKTVPIKATSMKIIVLRRLNALGKKKKKKSAFIDVALIIYRLVRNEVFNMNPKYLKNHFTKQGVPVDDDLIDEIQKQFPGPRSEKELSVNILAVADYMKRLWPDRVLPPPEPVVEIPEPVKPAGKKGKKDDKKTTIDKKRK